MKLKLYLLLFLPLSLQSFAQSSQSTIDVSANIVSGCYIESIPSISFINPQLMVASNFGLSYLSQDYSYFDFKYGCSKGTQFNISVNKETFQFPLKSAFAPLLRHTTNVQEYPIAAYLFNSQTKIDATTILPMQTDASQKQYIGTGKKEVIPMTLVLGNTNFFYGYKYQYIQGDYSANVHLNILY